MTSSKPYLLRAIYEWLIDNQLTPYVMVNADDPHVQVPERYIENGKIVLNISPQAVHRLAMTNEKLSFDARFSGVVYHIQVPTTAIQAVYAFENGRGMVFDEEEFGDTQMGSGGQGEGDFTPPKAPTTPGKGRPSLKVVK